jgi:hypothetical protein
VCSPRPCFASRTDEHLKPNFRSREFPSVRASLAAALAALVPLVLLAKLAGTDVFHPSSRRSLYCLGVLCLGLLDDTLGEEGARGWRGHGSAVLRGEISTGVLKAVGCLGLALLAAGYLGLSVARWLLAVGVLVLCTNVFNLLDLRPGRSTKAFVVLGAALALGSSQLRPLWSLGLFAAPVLVAGAYDLRERAMLGDTGANLLGALAGLWLVLTLSGTGQLVALAVLATITVYGEIRSISELVERTPGCAI